MTPRNQERFRDRLADQLAFLKTSCERFDAGDKREAIRIATVLRVLFHDTTDRKGRPLSVSLLSHLDAKDKVWWARRASVAAFVGLIVRRLLLVFGSPSR